MTLNEKLLQLRKKEGLSQESLAEKLGVTRQTISNWELGQTTPDLLQAGKISGIFKISLDELVDNQLDVVCRDNSPDYLYQNLLNKTCCLILSDDFDDWTLNYTTPVKVLDINDDFIKIEYQVKNQKEIKMIDMDLVESIKVTEEDEK